MKYRVRAIIIEDNNILLITRTKNDLTYLVLPGGGVEDYDDTFPEAIKRECQEELGIEIEVKDKFDEERFDAKNSKQVEYFYISHIISGDPKINNKLESRGGYKLEWWDLDKIKDIDLRPNRIRDKILQTNI